MKYLEANAPDWLGKLTRTRRGRVERLFWQPGGGCDRNIDNPATIRPVIDYFHENPTRRGLVNSPLDWYWSSARWYHDQTPGPCLVHPITEFLP